MRYLNKIIFINSANVKYTEIDLDGNVHFIGTQGAGKSTLLRAILFFYNATTRKLGIPTGPTNKSYADFYFPNSNSMIIYEVSTENGSFSVLSIKKQNHIGYYFLDTQYKKEIFIDEHGKAKSQWNDIRKVLDRKKIVYSKYINSYEEYLKIIYGNSITNPKLKRFYLLKSKQYKNIPRTIQNVFLNSKLEADVIKKTIITSMNEVDFSIDLNTYTHLLHGFETQLTDIERIENPVVRKIADKIVKLYHSIQYFEKEFAFESKNLVWKTKHVQQLVPESRDKLDDLLNRKKDTQSDLKSKEIRYHNKQQQLSNKISVCNDHIKRAKKQKVKYKELNITDIINRFNEKDKLIQTQQNLINEKNLLKSEFMEMTQKYSALKKEITNLKGEATNLANHEKNEKQKQYFIDKDKIKEKYESIINEIHDQHQTELDFKKNQVEAKKEQISGLKNQLFLTKQQHFYNKEITNISNEIDGIKRNLKNQQQEQNHLSKEIKFIQKESQQAEDAKHKFYQNQNQQLTNKIKNKHKKLEEINHKLKNIKDSFYHWLDKNKPGWKKNIGKICHDDMLFQKNLNPQKTSDEKTSLFGVEITVENIEKSVNTIQDYENDMHLLKGEIDSFNHQVNENYNKLSHEIAKINRRYQKKIKEMKQEVDAIIIDIDQKNKKLERQQVVLLDYQEKAASEKKNQIEKFNNKIEYASQEFLSLTEDLDTFKSTIKGKIKYRKKHQKQELKKLEQHLNHSILSIDKILKTEKEQLNQRLQQLENEEKNELQNKGAKTDRLAEIEEQLKIIKDELDFIEENRNLIAEYQKDKRELFDTLPSINNKKNLLHHKQDEEKHKFQVVATSIQEKLDTLDERIEKTKNYLKKLELELDIYEKFKKSEIFQLIAKSNTKGNIKTDKSLSDLIYSIRENFNKKVNRTKDLERNIRKFSGEFSADNIFKFKVSFEFEKDFFDFAKNIIEFIDEHKIEEYKNRITNRFTFIINTIGKEVTDLISKKGEIGKIISKINKDFVRKNFVGAVNKIELKMDESNNEVYNILQSIKEFNDKNQFSIGELSLFANDDIEMQNQKIVDYLKRLVKKINDNKYEKISLSDSFDLKFRIEENNNDTGWVEKLSNVGSDGTDVLVKAMVNIMLLNVFKESSSKFSSDFKLHCVMDEIGKLHPENVKGILRFANERNIRLINGSPMESNALDYRHIYKVKKDRNNITKVIRIITNN